MNISRGIVSSLIQFDLSYSSAIIRHSLNENIGPGTHDLGDGTLVSDFKIYNSG